MPLVKPLAADDNEEVAELARFFNETLGFCPNSVLTMQRRPAIAKAFINLNMAVMANDGRVTAEQKRLIGYITSANTGCRYCEAHTILAAERYGGTEERLANIWSFRESELYTAGEKAAFEFALAASSVPNAVDMAECVAENIMGAGKTYVPQPWFWSDQYDVKLQIAGLNTGYDRIVSRPGANEGAMSFWYFKGETLLAVDAANDARAYMVGKRLIETGKSPQPDAIADRSVELKSLLKA